MPRCKSCRQKFEQYAFNNKYCKEIDCQTEKAMMLLSKKKENQAKKVDVKFQEMKLRVKTPDRKKELGLQIRLLARKIDNYFNYLCVDCGKPYGKQQDAAHLHNSGGNENITYNLHNLHSSRSHCNRFSSEHKVGYRKGIEERYGAKYLDYIDFELPKIYKYIGLLDNEVIEKLAIVRKLNREFETFKLSNAIDARSNFNNIIGIYPGSPTAKEFK